MVGTLPPSLFELRRTSRFAHPTQLPDLILRSRVAASRRMNGTSRASWFETALTRLLTMRVGQPSRARHAPDDVADIVGHQQRAVGAERDADRPAVGDLLVGREKPGQNIPRRTGRAPV